MQKFEQRHNDAHHNRRVSRKIRKFHRNGMRYNISKSRHYCESEEEYYWSHDGQWADINNEDYEANSHDFEINKRCIRFTGIQTR